MRLRVAIAAVALALSGCNPAGESATLPDVVLVVVDTLRADHTGVHGYARDTTPALDEFASAGLVFENARSQASCTFPSANSLLTSRYPGHFLDQPEGGMGIPDATPSLATILKDAGYRTVAVSASPIVREHPSEHNPRGGFETGFDVFDEECLWREAECVNDRAASAIEAGERPLFLYLHYMDPHDPYRPPESYARRWAGEYEGLDFIGRGVPNPIGHMLYGDGPRFDVTEADIGHLRDLYDDEIRYFDRSFGELLDRLEERPGGLTDTILVVAADHGEEFLEHEHIRHCRELFDTLVHTPLVMRLPSVTRPRRISHPVENLDILPTVLDYAGIPFSPDTFDGTSLRPSIEGDPPPANQAFSSQGAERSIAGRRYKLIADLGSGEYSLFDLRVDPGETEDLSGREPGILATTIEELWAMLAVAEAGATRAEALRRAEAVEERLRALGYIR